MRARTTVSMTMTACAALVVCACGPGDDKGDADTKPSASTSASASADPSAPSSPSSSARPEKPSATPPTGDQPAPKTKEGAIKRYEQYLHALGREDINTVCEVAGPAAKKAENQGLGPCTSTYTAVFKMISPAQKTALRTATVDPGRVVVRTPAKVEMPVAAVKSEATFSESDLGSYTLEYLKDEWYITD
ncbi:hypothetical protein SLNWT_4124 [Streptomyces albus]|uniref:Lipoprotein n=1 Tax=Streptomyces albus (strain ATCC 21838 / DSM 41398 / FERM P-419 / JCM 4703 / NBRC 107858) TaxID=1081613 RepID=A0A0B5EYN6_STRA4|nr:hypothetical protein SLNWT_4124 [Streptomyces albus]AOU78810.1 hypothetical protein SLNHY_4119 [Streptomyces albus]AYN34544.1 hypothetical protein DUI70_4045 [Streptomyces albus]